jgi:hypothetical protein
VATEGDDPVQVPKLKLRPDFQAGQAINFVALITLIWTVSNGFANLIATMVTERTEMKQQIAMLMADRSKYVPMIEAVVNSDAVQKAQIQSIADNMAELKANQQQFSLQITTAVNTMQNDLATIKARSENSPKTR